MESAGFTELDIQLSLVPQQGVPPSPIGYHKVLLSTYMYTGYVTELAPTVTSPPNSS